WFDNTGTITRTYTYFDNGSVNDATTGFDPGITTLESLSTYNYTYSDFRSYVWDYNYTYDSGTSFA
ncbi:MAG TPA: hypothetical protein VHN20_18770, partial [Beijerinckiaceae bacterium]|nr:hypothetical protein [Beijerinckiaceae bacterium]